MTNDKASQPENLDAKAQKLLEEKEKSIADEVSEEMKKAEEKEKKEKNKK